MKKLKQIITMLLTACIIITGSCLDGKVVVNAAAKPVIRPVQLGVIKNSYMLGKGDKEKLTAWSGGTDITGKCTWKSSKTDVLAVSVKGVLTGKKEGISYVTAEYKGKTSKKLRVYVVDLKASASEADEYSNTNAAENYIQLENGSTVSMKAGERKRFLVTDSNGNDMIPFMKWTTKDKNTVMISSDFVDEEKNYTEYIEFIAIKAGTTTITGRELKNDAINQFNGTDKSFDTDITVTVTVTELETETEDQAKCRHSWETVTESTCQYSGLRPCRKCGIQKQLKKLPHQFQEVETYENEVINVYFEVFCDDGCALDSTVKLSDYASADEIKNAHYYETNNGEGRITWHLAGVSDSVAKKYAKAVQEAMEKHSHALGNWFYGGSDVYGEEFVKTRSVECINCGTKKQ